jgi:thiol-disulfide isomerase/thioredoxin
MRRRLALAALVLVCVANAVHPFHRGAEKGEEKKAGLLAVGDPAPEWKLADPSGKTHTLADYRGRVVVLDFWATWCGPCAKVMPRLEKLQKKYGERGLAVLGVNSFETGDPVALMKKKGITYTLLLKGEELAATYGVTSLPVVYVIGSDGRVLYSHAGPDTKKLDDVIEKQFGEQDK